MQTQTTVQKNNYTFPVILEDAFDLRGKRVPKTKLVVRKDTDDVLSTVSERYKLVPHAEVKDFADSFMKGLGKYEERATVEKNGARLVMEHTFRDITITLPGHKIPGQSKVNDVVALRMYSTNSYNTTTPFEIQLGALVLRCLNGATAFANAFHLKFRHVGKEEIILPKPDLVLSAFQEQGKAWKTWSMTGVNESHIDKVITGGKALQLFTEKTYSQNESYFRQSETVWDLYNAATYVISRNPKIQESSRITRFDRLNGLFNHIFSAAPQETL